MHVRSWNEYKVFVCVREKNSRMKNIDGCDGQWWAHRRKSALVVFWMAANEAIIDRWLDGRRTDILSLCAPHAHTHSHQTTWCIISLLSPSVERQSRTENATTPRAAARKLFPPRHCVRLGETLCSARWNKKHARDSKSTKSLFATGLIEICCCCATTSQTKKIIFFSKLGFSIEFSIRAQNNPNINIGKWKSSVWANKICQREVQDNKNSKIFLIYSILHSDTTN